MHLLILRILGSALKQQVATKFWLWAVVGLILGSGAATIETSLRFHNLRARVQRTQHYMVYLTETLAESKESEILSAIQKLGGVRDAEMINRDTFLKKAKKSVEKPQFEEIDRELLPRFVRVRIERSGADSTESPSKIFESIRGVESVEKVQTANHRVSASLGWMERWALLAGLLLSIGVAVVLVSRFSFGDIFHQQVMRTMKSLGATRSQLWVPWVLEGAAEGILSGICGAILFFLLQPGISRLFDVFAKRVSDVDGVVGVSGAGGLLVGGFLVVVVGLCTGVIASVWVLFRAER